MAWIIYPAQIADENGNPTGRWRMVAESDEDGGGPYGDTSHSHASSSAAIECEKCDIYTSGIAGFPTRRKQKEQAKEQRRAQYEQLKKEFEGE